MQEIKVTVELCPEDRGRLDAILSALQNAGTPYPAPVVSPDTPVIEDIHTASTPATKPEKQTAEPTIGPSGPSDSAQITAADIQRKVVALSAAGLKDEVKAIVKAYAVKVTAIPEDKRAEVWEKLSKLGEEA